MVSFACPIFFKIGRALWALISNIGLKKLSPNPIGQVPARLGPNSKETKNYSSYSRTAYSYAKNQAHLMYTRVDLQNTKITNKMTNRYKQTQKMNKQTQTTKSNIQKHLKQWTHYFLSIFFWCPHLVESPGVFLNYLLFFSGQIHFCRWFACLFPVPGLGLAGMAIYLFAKIWERISHRLGRVIFIVLFHFECDVVFSPFVIIFSTILEPFSFVSCQTCGWSASVLVWTLLQVFVPRAQRCIIQRPTKENKERESGNMNSKGEIWKHTESQREKHIKTGIPH